MPKFKRHLSKPLLAQVEFCWYVLLHNLVKSLKILSLWNIKFLFGIFMNELKQSHNILYKEAIRCFHERSLSTPDSDSAKG
jgi:hypothetical protein